MQEMRVAYLPQINSLDTSFQEDVWSRADWQGGFTLLTRPDESADLNTQMALAHDGKFLHAVARCESGPTDATSNTHDHLQFMIDTQGRGESCGLFILNRDGSIKSNYLIGEALHAWPGKVHHTVHEVDGGWIAHFALNFKTIPLDPDEPTQWRCNIVRGRSSRSEGLVWSSLAPLTTSAFWLPCHVAIPAVVEQAERLTTYRLRIEQMSRSIVSQESGTAKSVVRITNDSASRRSLILSASLLEDDRCRVEPIELLLDPKAVSLQELTIEWPDGLEHGQLEVSLSEQSEIVKQQRFLIERESLGWKEHWLRESDGQGGARCVTGRSSVLPRYRGRKTCPFGLATMNNGEVICVATAWPEQQGEPEQTLISFSKNDGATWCDYVAPEGMHCRPMMLAYLGRGTLTFEAGDTVGAVRYYSSDYGRTWEETVPVEPSPDGAFIGYEGNPLIDRDAEGRTTRMAQIGHTLDSSKFPHCASQMHFRWSEDLGRTWSDAVTPEPWWWEDSYRDQPHRRGNCEGSLVRAANGWIIAALRTDMPARYLDHPMADDSLHGTGVSISRDDGATWSPMQQVFEPGRHHPTLLRLHDDRLLMIVIRRVDIRDGGLASYRRGCDAVISKDHGQTWDTSHLICVDEFTYCDHRNWIHTEVGHLAACALPDNSVLCAYGNYLSGGVVVNWIP